MRARINFSNLIVFPLSVIAILIILFYWHYDTSLDDMAIIYFTTIMLLLLLVRSEFKYANLYSLEMFFIIIVFIHHLFYPIGVLLGFVSDTISDKASINTLFIVMLGLSGMILGSSLWGVRPSTGQSTINSINLNTLIKIGLYVWIASIGLEILLHILSGGQAFVVRSLTKLRGEVSWIERILSLNHVFGHVGLFLLVIASLHCYGRLFSNPIYWGILIVNMALISLTGDRQEAFILAIVLLYLKSRISKPINIIVASTICLFLLFFIVVIGEGRSKQEKGVPVYRGIIEEMHVVEPTKKDRTKVVYSSKPEESLFEKFWRKTGAGYYNAKRTYLNLNTKNFDLQYGKSYLYSLMSWLPFKSLFIEYMGYSEWCAMVGDPYAWKLRGHGTGGSVIGEAYWNFGIWGLIFICPLFGLLSHLIDNSICQGKNILLITFYATLIYSLIYMVRNDFSLFVKLACWHGFVILLIVLFLKLIFLNKNSLSFTNPVNF